ncbi:GNAT family N-acetyltransferase [Treponema sp.]|uniref:GNAT family N-acetyltransferase n=1 Tax=Treponema sp. TaxID=166 RepID=UPI0025EC191C|nr:GNAT family N-acetyltransferase [Treponema sp.]MCR5217079.1 GNAT family N-acetyltransferase [Treponema sp.]
MVEIVKACVDDINDFMKVRLEMLRIVNSMKDEEDFSPQLISASREYFLNGNHTTVFAKDDKKIIGCASVSYITIMPTYDHPSGKRAHLMNVYTNKNYRRQGIAKSMLKLLIDETVKKGCSEITLDATEEGFPLYLALGFKENKEGMVMNVKDYKI